jgi:hypothetical protein
LNNAAQSPVTLEHTADAATIPSASWAYAPLLSAPSDTTIRLSVWVYPITTNATIRLGLQQQDGATTTDTSYVLPANKWHKLVHEGSAGSGLFAPRMLLRATGAPANVYLSWQRAGIRDEAAEARILPFFPIHTRGAFAVQFEYAVLLSHPSLEANY